MIKLEPAAEDFRSAAEALGVTVAVIRAVAEVEAPRGAFELDPKTGDWRPTILFERHYFSRLTGGRFDGRRVADKPIPRAPVRDTWVVSDPDPGGYGRFKDQHDKLDYAVKLGALLGYPSTRDAALKSCSWGMFQLMGLYHAETGHPTVQGFVNAMFRGADRHLQAFVALVKFRGLDVNLRRHDWAGFARRYNGAGYAKNKYDIKLAAAYKEWAAKEDDHEAKDDLAPGSDRAADRGCDDDPSRGG